MIDSVIRLGTCNRCHGYVFVAQSSGFKVAADPAPVTRERYIETLVGGRRVFDLVEQAGRPHKLLTRSSGSSAPQWVGEAGTGLSVASRPPRRILAEHACGAKGISTTKVEVTEVNPPSAPVMPGGSRGGLRRGDAPGSTTTRSSVAEPVIRPPSRCDTCRKAITSGQMYYGVHHMKWQMVWHEECP